MRVTRRENIIVRYKFDYLLECLKYISDYVKENGVIFYSLDLEKYEITLDKCIYEFIFEGLNLIADGVNNYILDMYLDCKANKISKYYNDAIIEQIFLVKHFLKFIYFGQSEELDEFLNEINY